MLFPSECIITRKLTAANEYTGIGIVFCLQQAHQFFEYCQGRYACYVVDETIPMRIECISNLEEAKKFYGKTLSA